MNTNAKIALLAALTLTVVVGAWRHRLPSHGKSGSVISIVEYADFQCESCDGWSLAVRNEQ